MNRKITSYNVWILIGMGAIMFFMNGPQNNVPNLMDCIMIVQYAILKNSVSTYSQWKS
jgi:hypothetical protein